MRTRLKAAGPEAVEADKLRHAAAIGAAADPVPPSQAMNADLIAQLRAAVGDAHVLTHEDPAADLSAWENDWRKRARGRALAVVRPGNTPEVAAVVKACAAAGASIVPQGGNTGLVVGSVPDDSGTQVVLSLAPHAGRARAGRGQPHGHRRGRLHPAKPANRR